jgi:hypothetical protein
MALKGQAKADYQREYMRRRRLGPAPKPKPAWQPTERHFWQMKYWVQLRQNRPWYLRGLGAEAIEGLEFDTVEEWVEACYRYRALTQLQRQGLLNPRRQGWGDEAEEVEQPRPPHCSFCGEPAEPQTRPLFPGDRLYDNICEACVTEAAKAFAARRCIP